MVAKVSYWCPPLISKPKQLESALEEISNADYGINFHIHAEDDECPGFVSPGGTVNNCWEYVPDGQK